MGLLFNKGLPPPHPHPPAHMAVIREQHDRLFDPTVCFQTFKVVFETLGCGGNTCTLCVVDTSSLRWTSAAVLLFLPPRPACYDVS